MALHSPSLTIIAAHMLKGRPPGDSLVPFRNIRDVLALHAKTSSDKPFLLHEAADGTRTDLTYIEFVARVHQVANFLYEDLQVKRGDVVLTWGESDATMLLISFACWIIGAAVMPLAPDASDAEAVTALQVCDARVAFIGQPFVARANALKLQAPALLGLVQVSGEATDEVIQLLDFVRSRPTTFLGDDSGAKSGDVPMGAGDARTAQLDDAALLIPQAGQPPLVLTQYNLLAAVWGITQAAALTGNQRWLSIMPLYEVAGLVMGLLAPLLVGATVGVVEKFDETRIWERIVREKHSSLAATPDQLKRLFDYATQQEQTGDTIFGQRISRREITRFRQFISAGGLLSAQLAADFERKFGFPVMYIFGTPATTGFVTALPLTLGWEEHQRWLHGGDFASIGCALPHNEAAVCAPDGSLMDAGQHGDICVRGHNVARGYYQDEAATTAAFAGGWLHTGYQGYYETDALGRQFFFVTE